MTVKIILSKFFVLVEDSGYFGPIVVSIACAVHRKTCLLVTKFNMIILILFRYVRAEVMAGFMNALFLMFVAFFIFSEAVEVEEFHLLYDIYINIAPLE